MPARVVTGEKMDDPAVDPAELRRALAYIRAVNRWLGGSRGLLMHLRRWSASWQRGKPVTLLDIGTGSADIPARAVAWAASRGFELRVTAVDNHDSTLAEARRRLQGVPGVELVRADARELDRLFQPGAFDHAHAGLFLHHLSTPDATAVLGLMGRLARRGVVWNDLVRARWALAAVNLILIGQPRIVVHDARASVRAGFTRGEALDMARLAGLTNVEYRTVIMHRFTLTGVGGG